MDKPLFPLFEEKYLHAVWNNELEGKDCYVENNIPDLIKEITYNEYTSKVTYSKDNQFPFSTSRSEYRFAYYDPYLKFKKAQNEGKQLWVKHVSSATDSSPYVNEYWVTDIVTEFNLPPDYYSLKSPIKDIDEGDIIPDLEVKSAGTVYKLSDKQKEAIITALKLYRFSLNLPFNTSKRNRALCHRLDEIIDIFKD